MKHYTFATTKSKLLFVALQESYLHERIVMNIHKVSYYLLRYDIAYCGTKVMERKMEDRV